MKKLFLIGLLFVGVQVFGQQAPKLPESIVQNKMSITKNNNGELVLKMRVRKKFSGEDVEAIKFYMQFYYGNNEKYVCWTPQIIHKRRNWTFVFNK